MEFSSFLFNKFLEWEKSQPKQRSSFSAFARWLSDNSYHVRIPQPTLDAWLNNRYKPGSKYIPVLIEKLGNDTSEYLNLDPLLTYITTHWDQLPPALQQTIQNQIQNYLANQGENNATTHPVQT